MTNQINNVVIVGGGTAGWLTASLLAKVLGKQISITLVESKDIATIGVGEATIPPIIPFNAAIGIDEKAFIKATNATIKLGIQFENWGQQGEHYMHAFGSFGKDFPFCNFLNYWLKAKEQGDTSSFWDYSINYQAAKRNRFDKLQHLPNTKLPGTSYAYHFDASLYAQFLRNHAEQLGVKRIEGKVTHVETHHYNGFVKSLMLENQALVTGDLFVDCSGLHGLLLDKTLNVGFEDWRHWLPCDSALAVPCEHDENEIKPYTRSIAHDAGWQWQIPLTNRIGNGLVYASYHLSDDDAKQLLLSNLPGKAIAEPKLIRFRTGRRLKQWHKNVVAIGLSSGFLEPLESTSIHLIQTAATRLVKHFPLMGINDRVVAEFNRQSQVEFERIRDFIILHYKLTERTDSAFWRQCKDMDVPNSLRHKIQLFAENALFFRQDDELFSEVAWQQVMLGQGIAPAQYHPLAKNLNDAQIKDLLESLKTLVAHTSEKLPTHNEFLKRFGN